MNTDRRNFADRLLTCEECGIDFIWTITQQRKLAEQGMTLDPPTRCPGCRHVAPQAGNTRGVVKWYNRTKGWGFITLANEDEVFVHRSGLAGGIPFLDEGDKVELSIEQTSRGPQAVDVRRLAIDSSSDSAS
jgi:CspA family cold shock protein